MRPARSLESKWGSIKHDVTKFCGAYKQVLDCRESGTSMEDVLDRALEYYRDRHPKHQGFTFLHCWTLLREVPRWWESPLDVQQRSVVGEGGPRGAAMAPARVTMPSQTTQEGEVESNDDRRGQAVKGEVWEALTLLLGSWSDPRVKSRRSWTSWSLAGETLS